jgi:hypothetical protein
MKLCARLFYSFRCKYLDDPNNFRQCLWRWKMLHMCNVLAALSDNEYILLNPLPNVFCFLQYEDVR